MPFFTFKRRLCTQSLKERKRTEETQTECFVDLNPVLVRARTSLANEQGIVGAIFENVQIKTFTVTGINNLLY